MEATQLTIEVRFLPLANQEAEERQRRLHTLFLTAALRLARQGSLPEAETILAEEVHQ